MDTHDFPGDDDIPFSELILQEPTAEELRETETYYQRSEDGLFQDFLARQGDFMEILTSVLEVQRAIEVKKLVGPLRRTMTTSEYLDCLYRALHSVLFFVSRKHPGVYRELVAELQSRLSKRDWERRRRKKELEERRKARMRAKKAEARLSPGFVPPPSRLKRLQEANAKAEKEARLREEMNLKIVTAVQTDLPIGPTLSEKPLPELRPELFSPAKRRRTPAGTQLYMPDVSNSFKEQEAVRYARRMKRYR